MGKTQTQMTKQGSMRSTTYFERIGQKQTEQWRMAKKKKQVVRCRFSLTPFKPNFLAII